MSRVSGRAEENARWVVSIAAFGFCVLFSACGFGSGEASGSDPVAEVADGSAELRSSEVNGDASEVASGSNEQATDESSSDDQLVARSQIDDSEADGDVTDTDGSDDGGDASGGTEQDDSTTSTTKPATSSSSETTSTSAPTSSIRSSSTTERPTTTRETTTSRPTTTTAPPTTRRTTTSTRPTTTTTTATTTTTTTTKPPDPLAMTYGAVGTEIKGDITAAGVPVAEVEVDLFLAITAQQRGEFLGDTRSLADGSWTLGELAPDCYIIVGIAPEGRVFIGGSRFKQRHICNDS